MQKNAVKLIMVEAENSQTKANNNKFYHMIPNADGVSFTAEWGRIGQSSSTQSYPISDWDKKYREKIKKGYRDNTELFIVESSKKDFLNIPDKVIENLVKTLQNYANASISSNYTVSSESVTQKQVDTAQNLLNELSNYTKIGVTADQINKILLEVFRTIPRKMGNVKDYIVQFDKIKSKNEKESVKAIIQGEQDLLDVMRGQVVQNAVQDDQDDDNQQNILEAMGIEMWVPSSEDIALIKRLLGGSSRKFNAAFGIKNKKTEEKFKEHLEKVKGKDKELLWHGSRNENWWSIINSGLVLRPTNAIRTGSMFGSPALYFADKADKSIGYSSLSGSRWARGSDNRGFLSLYDVHIGKQLEIERHEDWCYRLNLENLKLRGDYDSVFAKKGVSLYNNEYIVYKQEQSTIIFLVELKEN